MCSSEILIQPDPGKHYKLETDASKFAIGCNQLSAEGVKGGWRVETCSVLLYTNSAIQSHSVQYLLVKYLIK